ncbi:MAG: hypothetical protein GY795_07165, partial [Desulfobacterales bacterium]|nr:hypothetical protein [Desulfobacterales bacterium]
MKRLRAFYEQLAGVRFGFFTGCLIGVLACGYFVDVASRFSIYFDGVVLAAFEAAGVFVGLVLIVRILGIFYRRFISCRSCNIESDPEELQQDIDSLRSVVVSDLNASHTL